MIDGTDQHRPLSQPILKDQTVSEAVSQASPIMKYFAYEHLPERLQKVSKPFGILAAEMDTTLPNGPEKSAGLRKLLEAKDCMVRASLG